MLSLDLRNQEEEKTSSDSFQCVKLPPFSPFPNSEQMEQVFSGISTSSVSRRLSDLHREHRETSSVFISVTETSSREASRESSDEEFVMVGRDSTKSSDSDSNHMKQRDSTSSEKSLDEKIRHDTSFRSSFEGSEMASPNNVVIEPFIKPSLEEIDDIMMTSEHKPIPTKKQLIKINSTDLLHRQIKEDMIEQVMCEEDDSMMTESVLLVNKGKDIQSSVQFSEEKASLSSMYRQKQ